MSDSLTGDLLTEAKVTIDQRFNEPYVSITFNAAGAKRFSFWSRPAID